MRDGEDTDLLARSQKSSAQRNVRSRRRHTSSRSGSAASGSASACVEPGVSAHGLGTSEPLDLRLGAIVDGHTCHPALALRPHRQCTAAVQAPGR